MKKDAVAIPRAVRDELRDVAARHRLGSAGDAALHFVSRGLDQSGAPPGPLAARLAHAVEAQGYSAADELIEHLIRRGLRAYQEPAASPEALAARLRGLGYID
jgi:hypothetical protein